ncbi:MAG TPA: SDR family oxidoreductase [Acidimicrobiales bacterium]|nr:SDR family oxidoreductase [Acidimicrobiales bacterium]
MADLIGQVAVVTGASSGVGRAAAVAWARAGAHVVAAARNLEALRELSEEIASFGGEARPVRCDVSVLDDVSELRNIATAAGPVSLLLNCAGVPGAYASLLETPLEVWQRTIDVNLTGTFNCCQAFLPTMMAARHGNIINVASSDRALPLRSAYHTTKFGIIALTQALAEEVREYGISVNAIRFGIPVDTPLAREVNGDRTDYENWQSPEDTTEVLTYLALQRGAYVTGGYINVYEWTRQLRGALGHAATPPPVR